MNKLVNIGLDFMKASRDWALKPNVSCQREAEFPGTRFFDAIATLGLSELSSRPATTPVVASPSPSRRPQF